MNETTLVWIWIGLAACSLSIQGFTLAECWFDRRFINVMGWNGAMHLTLDTHTRNATVRTAIVSNNLVLGLMVFLFPRVLAWYLPAGLLANEVLLVTNSLYERIVRHKVATVEGHDASRLPSRHGHADSK